MNDAQEALTRYGADKPRNVSDVLSEDYVLLFLPFQEKGYLVKVFEDIINGLRDMTELPELLEIFNLTFSKETFLKFVSYYKVHTKESPMYIYMSALLNAVEDLAEIIGMIDTETEDQELLEFLTEITDLYLSNKNAAGV